MKKSSLIQILKTKFDIRELVCPHLYRHLYADSWVYLDFNILYILYALRFKILNTPMIINTYHLHGLFSQRGYRCQVCLENPQITPGSVSYFSAHCLGKAFDFHCKDIPAESIRQLLISDPMLLKYHFRLETNISWVHIDSLNFNELLPFEIF